MEVLLSNDDGIYAEGLKALSDALIDFQQTVTVVAPDRNRSGASNSLTLAVPLHVGEIAPRWYRVEGTPTDCVHLAMTGLLDTAFDMVVSGINEGANLGDDVLYSGTVAAATEGRFLGVPAIAVSLAMEHHVDEKHYATAGQVIVRLLKRMMLDPLPADTILNVNVPNVPFDAIQGYEVTRLGTRHQSEPTIIQQDPRGRKVYWIGPPGAEEDAGFGTDFHAIARHHVSITPLRVDATRYESFEQLSQWVTELD